MADDLTALRIVVEATDVNELVELRRTVKTLNAELKRSQARHFQSAWNCLASRVLMAVNSQAFSQHGYEPPVRTQTMVHFDLGGEVKEGISHRLEVFAAPFLERSFILVEALGPNYKSITIDNAPIVPMKDIDRLAALFDERPELFDALMAITECPEQLGLWFDKPKQGVVHIWDDSSL
jgi:hypothetical protein